MSSVERPEFAPGTNDHRSSEQVSARKARAQAVSEAADRVFEEAQRHYVAGGRRSSAQDAIDASARAWNAAHPDRSERVQARRDADAVHVAASRDLDEVQARRDREIEQERQARRGAERLR